MLRLGNLSWELGGLGTVSRIMPWAQLGLGTRGPPHAEGAVREANWGQKPLAATTDSAAAKKMSRSCAPFALKPPVSDYCRTYILYIPYLAIEPQDMRILRL